MTGGTEWRHAPEACAEDFGDLKTDSELSSCLGRRRLTFGARRGLAVGAARGGDGGGGGDAHGKVSVERLCLSPHVENLLTQR